MAPNSNFKKYRPKFLNKNDAKFELKQIYTKTLTKNYGNKRVI